MGMFIKVETQIHSTLKKQVVKTSWWPKIIDMGQHEEENRTSSMVAVLEIPCSQKETTFPISYEILMLKLDLHFLKLNALNFCLEIWKFDYPLIHIWLGRWFQAKEAEWRIPVVSIMKYKQGIDQKNSWSFWLADKYYWL